MTVTNWSAGIAAGWSSFPWRRTLQITANAFCVVTLLWGLQRYAFPSVSFFIGDTEEKSFVRTPGLADTGSVLRALIFHAVVMPEIQLVEHPETPACSQLRVQQAPIASGSPWAWPATGAWTLLLGLAAWTFTRPEIPGALRLTLGLYLSGQIALHTLYGPETFLYTLNFLPAALATAALATRTPARPVALGAAVLLLATNLPNNWHALEVGRQAVSCYERTLAGEAASALR